MSDVVFETQRCRVRDWRDDEAPRLFDLYGRREVARWLGRTPQEMQSLDQAKDAVAGWRSWNEERAPAGRWAVERRDDGVVAGTVLLVPLPDGDGEFEVGWHFHPDSWGKGFATESARGAIAYGFEQGLEEVFAVVRPDNAASLAVCRRLGMEELGPTTTYYDTELELFRATP